MDEYGLSPLTMLRIMSPILVIGPIVLWLLVMGPFVLYLIARWRAHRAAEGDPQLGLKVALHYFGLLGAQVALAGAMLLVWAIVGKWSSSERGDVARTAFGLLVPSLIIYGVHIAALRRTNDERALIARRLFQGYHLIIVGLVGFTGFVLVFQALFQKGSSGDFGRFAAALLVVYGGAWAVSAIRFARLSLGATPEPPRDAGSPPAPTATAPAAPSGPTLPSLGGGSFPPVTP